jgi:DNA polymerase-3 subunit gamma/tau
VAIREGRALDLVEIDAASNRGIDQIRDLREKVRYTPTDLRRKIYILDEAHQITRDGWAALLKTLEEPPEHVVFMFASTDPQAIPPTILSRVQRFDFRRLRAADIGGKLELILADAGREADADAVELIARLAAGGMRDAESMLDQLLSTGDGRLTADGVRDLLGLADQASVGAFVDALVAPDPAAGVAILDDLEDRGRDLRTFGEQVIDTLRERIAAGLIGEAADGGVPLADLARAARRLAGTDLHRDRAGGARLALELALLLPLVEGVTAAPAVARQPSAAPAPAPTAVPPRAVRPEPAAPKPEPEPGAAGGDEIARVRAHWPEILAAVGRNPAARPLIEACRPIAVDGRVIVLGFPEDKAFLASALERRRSVLEEGISQVLGASYGVRCVATNVEDLPDLAVDEDGRALIEKARRIFVGEPVDAGEVS